MSMIYVSAPSSTHLERKFAAEYAALLSRELDEVIALPQEFCRLARSGADQCILRRSTLRAAKMLVACIHGAGPCTEVTWEIGQASALGIAVCALRFDPEGELSPLVIHSCTQVFHLHSESYDMMLREATGIVRSHYQLATAPHALSIC